MPCSRLTLGTTPGGTQPIGASCTRSAIAFFLIGRLVCVQHVARVQIYRTRSHFRKIQGIYSTSVLPCPSPPPFNTVQIVCAAIRTTEEIITVAPQMNIMRDAPLLAGKQVRYVMVFCFEEKGKPVQSLLRARSLVLGEGSASTVLWGGQPAGWETVNTAILHIFGSPGEPVVVVDTP